MDLWINIISGFFGAIVGGACSILGVIITQRSEGKQRKEADERKMQMFMLQKNREAKEKLYIALAQLLEGITTIIEADENTGDMCLSQDEAEKNHKALMDFNEKDLGMLSIYCPPSIREELLKLTSELYKISSEKQTITIEDLQNIKTSSITRAQLHAKNITLMIRKDLNIADIPSK